MAIGTVKWFNNSKGFGFIQRDKGDDEILRQAAHFPNVLFVMQRDDDGTGAEKEQRFKERVREKMIDSGVVRREPDGHDHVTELRERGVSENAFDVVLLRGNERSHDRGDRSDPGNDIKRRWRRLDDESNSHQHINAGCNHGGGMDQRRDWGRAFHCVRQPNVQWKLS